MLRASLVSIFTAVLIAATRLRFRHLLRRKGRTPFERRRAPDWRDWRARPTPWQGLARTIPRSPGDASCRTQHVGSGREGYAPDNPPSTALFAASQQYFNLYKQSLTDTSSGDPRMPESPAESSPKMRPEHNMLCPPRRHRKSTACAPRMHKLAHHCPTDAVGTHGRAAESEPPVLRTAPGIASDPVRLAARRAHTKHRRKTA